LGRLLGEGGGTYSRNLRNAEELPDDEMELVFSSAFGKLTQAAKMQALAELRAKKGIRCN
jgi:hypothetical protein